MERARFKNISPEKVKAKDGFTKGGVWVGMREPGSYYLAGVRAAEQSALLSDEVSPIEITSQIIQRSRYSNYGKSTVELALGVLETVAQDQFNSREGQS